MVELNKTYTAAIGGMTYDGMGIARINGFAVFVRGAIPGEEAVVKVIKVYKGYAIGRLEKILTSSPARTEPFCDVYKRCGGCTLQHMDYRTQLEFKTNQVKDSLERIGKLYGLQVNATLGMENPYGYRNKAQYPVGLRKGEYITGFYALRSHEIIDSENCLIQDANNERVRKIVKQFLEKKRISVYDESGGRGLVRHLVTRTGFSTGQVMVILVINGGDLPGKDGLIRELTANVPGITSIVLNINTAKTNVVMGEKNITIYGNDYITDTIGGREFRISPNSFFQVNPVQTEVLYEKVKQYAALTGRETVFDVYCGIGTIALYLSGLAEKVYGIEEVEQAVEDARINARINNIANVEFIAGKAEVVTPQLASRGIRPVVVVLDPPRKGCDKAVLDAILQMRPYRIVYVSCNPATLARDLNYITAGAPSSRELSASQVFFAPRGDSAFQGSSASSGEPEPGNSAMGGYKVREVQPIDMFPHTHHVETLVLMSKK